MGLSVLLCLTQQVHPWLCHLPLWLTGSRHPAHQPCPLLTMLVLMGLFYLLYRNRLEKGKFKQQKWKNQGHWDGRVYARNASWWQCRSPALLKLHNFRFLCSLTGKAPKNIIKVDVDNYSSGRTCLQCKYRDISYIQTNIVRWPLKHVSCISWTLKTSTFKSWLARNCMLGDGKARALEAAKEELVSRRRTYSL